MKPWNLLSLLLYIHGNNTYLPLKEVWAYWGVSRYLDPPTLTQSTQAASEKWNHFLYVCLW